MTGVYGIGVRSDVQKRRFALLLHAGYGERYA